MKTIHGMHGRRTSKIEIFKGYNIKNVCDAACGFGAYSLAFDGVIAHAVLDHLTKEDANCALSELLQITIPNGLILISFDTAEEDDFKEEHIVLEDGTMQYIKGARSGMLFHPYDWKAIDSFLEKYHVIHKADNFKNEKIVILQKI